MADDDRSGYGNRFRDEGRGRSGGNSERDYGRDDRWQGRDRERDYRDDDRGFFARGSDEVRSWFGDDEAERRRQADERRDPQGTSHYRSGPAGQGWGNQTGSQFGRPPSADYGQGGGSYSGFGGYSGDASRYQPGADGHNAFGGSQSHHEPEYRSWRDKRMSEYDREYDEYRKHRETRFHSEFDDWRTNRATQAGAAATGAQWSTKVREHQEVLGADGEHVGTVDHVEGDHIKLAKTDPASGGHHHLIPLSSVVSVDSAVRLNVSAAEAKKDWKRPTT